MIAPIHNQVETLFSEPALFEAWERIAARHSAPGIDRVSVDNFSRNVGQRLRTLRSDIFLERYKPAPLVSFPRTKDDGRIRCLNIATVRDRVVARVLADTFVRHHDPELQPQSYAYRPGRGALKAVSAAQTGCRNHAWVVRLDIAEFFESLDHTILSRTLADLGWSGPVTDMVRQMIATPRFDGVKYIHPQRGIPLGLPLAPVLSNLYLDSFDADLNAEQFAFIRYADDIVVFAKSTHEAAAALNTLNRLLQERKLTPSLPKTRIYEVRNGFLFLGFLFRPEGHVAGPKARTRLLEKMDEPQFDDESLEDHGRRKDAIRRGWKNYYGSVLEMAREIPESAAQAERPSGLENSKLSLPETPGDEETTDANQENPAEASPPVDLLETCRDMLDNGRFSQCVYAIRRALSDDTQNIHGQQRTALQQLLSHAYETMGLTGAARCCRPDSGPPTEPPAMPGPSKPASGIQHSVRQVEEWIEVFCPDNAIMAQQFVDRLGRHGFRPGSEGLTPKMLSQHWEGRRTLAAPVYADDDRVRFGVLDLDISRAALDHLAPHEREALLTRMLDDARGLLDHAHRAGVRGLLEDSGYKGYHVWFFMQAPVNASLMKAFLATLDRIAGNPPEGSHRELFPASDHRPPESIGRYIKMPLGLHRLTERRSRFLAPDGRPCENGIELLGSSCRNRAGALRAAIDTWTRFRPSENPPNTSHTDNEDTSNAAILMDRCNVLKGLEQKARQTNHLSHAERLVLRGVLGVLDEDGRKMIHAILRHCSNYSATRTTQMIDRPTSKPLGCARIREFLGQFCADVGCDCRFKTRKNDYAHPLRWLSYPSLDAGATEKVLPATPGEEKNPSPSVGSSREPGCMDTSTQTTSAADSGEPLTALLSRVHLARRELLTAQAELVSAMQGRSHADLPVGCLRHNGPDPDIKHWIIET